MLGIASISELPLSTLPSGGGPPPETITVDKWYKQHENPIRKAVAIASIVVSFFFVPVVSQAETITVDKWMQPISQPHKKIERRQAAGAVRTELPCMVDIVGYNAATGSGTASPSLSNLPANCLLVLTTSHDAGNVGLLDCLVSSSPSLTWTKRVDDGGVNNHNAEIWTAIFTAGGNITVTADWPSAGSELQAAVLHAITNAESPAAGATASANSQALPSVNINTTKPDTLFFAITADWNAIDGSSRAYRENASETLYYRPSGALTTYGYFKRGTTDQTLHTLGLTAPGGQQAVTVILEVRSNCPINTEWIQPIQQPYFSKKRDSKFGETRFEVPRTIIISDWFAPVGQPQNKKAIRQTGGETRTEVVVTAETVTLDKWYRPASEPYFTKRREVNTGQTFLDVPRTVLLTDWFQPASVPLKQPPRKTDFGEYKFELPRTILVTDWHQPIIQPVVRKVQRQQGDYQRPDIVAGDTHINEWYQPASEPHFSKRRFYLTGEFKFEVPRTILLNDWFQPVQQPYFSKYRDSNAGEFRFEVPRTILLTDWFQPTQQPFFSKIRDSYFGEYRFEVPRTILVTDWFQPISQPVVRKVQRQQGLYIRLDLIAEDTQLNEWYQPASEPYFSKRRFYLTGEFRFEVPREVLLTDWFQAASEPLRSRIAQYKTRVIQSVFQVEILIEQPQPDRQIFGWKQQPQHWKEYILKDDEDWLEFMKAFIKLIE